MNLVKGTLAWSVVALTVIVLSGAALFGWKGALAGSLGVVVTDLDLVTLGLFSQVLVAQSPGPKVTRLCILFLLLKLPALVGALLIAMRLGQGGVGSFLVGVALVYCAMVHVAIRDAKSGQQDFFS